MGQGRAEEAATLLVLPRVQEPSHLAHTHSGPEGSLFYTEDSRPLFLRTPGSSSLTPESPDTQPLLPSGPESGPPALAFPDLEKPGKDVKLEDGHVAVAGEVNGRA